MQLWQVLLIGSIIVASVCLKSCSLMCLRLLSFINSPNLLLNEARLILDPSSLQKINPLSLYILPWLLFNFLVLYYELLVNQ